MSRIGKKPLEIPKTVKAVLQGQRLEMEGPKGKLTWEIHSRVRPVLKDSVLLFQTAGEGGSASALQGTSRSVAANMLKGVTEGYVKELLIEGVGFKAQVQGKKLELLLGFTHPVIFELPEGVTVEAPKPTQVFVKGIDKVKVGLFAAKIRRVFEAEPYNGKGVRYAGEVVRRKAGKTVTK